MLSGYMYISGSSAKFTLYWMEYYKLCNDSFPPTPPPPPHSQILSLILFSSQCHQNHLQLYMYFWCHVYMYIRIYTYTHTSYCDKPTDGFRKVSKPEQHTLVKDVNSENLEFWHTNFRRGHPELLHLVQRKVTTLYV